MADTCANAPTSTLWTGKGRTLHYPLAAPKDGRPPAPPWVDYMRQVFHNGSTFHDPRWCVRASRSLCDARFSIDGDHLLGARFLSGVDFIPGDDDPAQIRFVLDGVTYAAIEDPDDGYRSALEGVFICKDKIANTFSPVPVVVSRLDDSNIYTIAHPDGRVIVEFGTDNSDDYYPCFVGRFDPTALGEI